MNKFAILLAFAIVAVAMAQSGSEDSGSGSSGAFRGVDTSSKKGKKSKSDKSGKSGVARKGGKDGKSEKSGKGKGKGKKGGLMRTMEQNAAGFATGGVVLVGAVAAAVGIAIRRRNSLKAGKEVENPTESTPLTSEETV
eukprot:m.330952 g.330952  ORF g.330952 m.330952 type:complete len:139 (+) comp16614_c0_seq1:127-543(+)